MGGARLHVCGEVFTDVSVSARPYFKLPVHPAMLAIRPALQGLRGRRALATFAGGFGHTLRARSRKPGFFDVTLSRPEVHNAFNTEMISSLTVTLDHLSSVGGLRAVFIGGEGRSFCAGGDLKWMRAAAELSAEENEEDALRLSRMLQKLANLPCATIALVQGNAFGGGVGIISACDIAIGVRSAFFSLSEVRLGLIPATISPYVVPRISPAQARRYFLTGERFDAERAKEVGLLHEIAEDDVALAQWAERLEAELTRSAPTAVAASKQLITAVQSRARDDQLLQETARRLSLQRGSAEGREGIAAFLGKRTPSWAE
jgi:methylglutaconyl-CoA hydratase